MKRIAILLVVVGLFASSAARADVQSNVPEVWPGKVMIGVNPLGVQVGLAGNLATVQYKLNLDVAGIIANLPKLTIWLGGEFNIGGAGGLAQIEPGVFVKFTLEKLLRIPLVPMISAGISGPIDFPYGVALNNGAFGAFEFKVGGGAYYFLTRNIGLGAETHFALGPAFYSIDGVRGTAWGGYFDFMAGARFAL